MHYYVYILCCADTTLYTGWTNDVPARVRKHNQGDGAKYTRCRLPVRIVYQEECASRSDALKREYAIKQLTRMQKMALIATFFPDNA